MVQPVQMHQRIIVDLVDIDSRKIIYENNGNKPLKSSLCNGQGATFMLSSRDWLDALYPGEEKVRTKGIQAIIG